MKITNSFVNFKANKMSPIQAKYVENELKKAKNVDIVCHNATDKDSANSALAMWRYLNSLGVNSRVIISQAKPEMLNLRTYDFDMIKASDEKEISKVQPDIVFCVDFGGHERVRSNVLEHIKKCPKVMGFDHHSELDIANGSTTQLKKELLNEEIVDTEADFYSDMSAKSTTSIIYRFFEAKEGEIDSVFAYDLFLGFVDDSLKRNLVKVDGKKGTIDAQKTLMEDENAYEVFISLKEKLSDEQIADIAKSVDILSFLTPEQRVFKNSLQDRLQYSNNGKIAYVEITPEDSEWNKLGGDNVVTNRILNNFRQELLAGNQDIEVAITFYRAHECYRLSAHSKKPLLLDFFRYVEHSKIPEFTKKSGGHANRAGGGVDSSDCKDCHKWVQDIISCDDFFS